MGPDAASDAATDSSNDGQPTDAAVAPRCNSAAAFGAPTLVPNVNSPLGTFSVALTADELTSFYTATDNGSEYVLKVATRGSKDDAFPAPTAAPALALINAETGIESSPDPVADGLAVYFQRTNSTTFTVTTSVAVRTAVDGTFAVGSSVRIDGNPLTTAAYPKISANGLTLYWTDDSAFMLRSASRTGGAVDAFFQQKIESTMSVGGGRFAISSDELTLYYGTPEIYVAIRASKNVPFGPGSLVPVLNSSSRDEAVALTGDGCLLYISSQRGGGVRATNIWVARRPQ